MARCILFIISVFIVVMAYGAADTTETRRVKDFTTVQLTGSSSVTIKEGNGFAVQVTGAKEALNKAETRVKGDTLVLSVKDRGWFTTSSKEVHFDITMPRIKGVKLTGSGDVDLDDSVTTESIDLSVTGSGDISADTITAKNMVLTVTGSGNIRIDRVEVIAGEAVIKGSGDIEVAGEVHTQRVRVMGSGNFKGWKLSAQVAQGSIMGSGDVDLGKAEQRSFNVMGSGEVRVGTDG